MQDNPSKKGNFLKPGDSGYFGSMFLLFIIIGLIISTQLHRHNEAEKSSLPIERQLNGLVVLLKETQNKKSDLEKQLTKLREQVEAINKKSISDSLTDTQFKTIYQVAGLTSINGNGIEIKLEEPNAYKGISRADLVTNDWLVHSEDLLKIVNELRASGAKAISINNQRLITTSEIVTAGDNILINQSKLDSPYVIKAIGQVDTMLSALKMRGGILEYLEVCGIKIGINRKKELKIPAYNKDIT